MSTNPLHIIMHPQKIVVAGASNNFMKMGTIQALNLLNGGYKGEVVFLHPKEEQIFGHAVYRHAADIPFVPDLAMLVTPTKITPGLLDELGERGVRHAVIITAGFREVGADGIELEAELMRVAAKHGIRFVGPNCIGVMNTHIGLNLTFFPYNDEPGHLGLVSQSGTYVTQTLVYLKERGIRYSQAISVGNSSSIDLVDGLEYLGDDPDTHAIALYIEGIRRGRDFIRVAREVSKKKPIVALYVGGSQTGMRAAASHTGSLGGPNELYNGIFEQAGVLRAETVEDLFGWGHSLACMPPPKGRRVAILTHSGGPASSMADACERHGLELPELSEELQAQIRPHIAATASAKNPVDLTFTMNHAALTETIPRLLFASDELDAVMVHGIMDTGFTGQMYDAIKDIAPIPREQFMESAKFDMSVLANLPRETGKPLTASTFIRDDNAAQAMIASGIPLFDAPESAVKAMAALANYGERQAHLRADGLFVAEFPEPKDSLLAQGGEGRILDEFAAKALLRDYGVPTADEFRVETLDDALAAAERLGYPIVLKGLPENVTHKSEAGLVKLGLAGHSDLKAAWEKVENVAPGCPRLVASQLKGTRELVVGMSRFPGFGPCVMLGVGGIFTEAIRDVSFRAAPVVRDDLKIMPDSLRMKRLFDAQRGLPPVDREALADILEGVGRLALEHPEVAEIDINPLIVVDGKPIAVDALVVLKQPTP